MTSFYQNTRERIFVLMNARDVIICLPTGYNSPLSLMRTLVPQIPPFLGAEEDKDFVPFDYL